MIDSSQFQNDKFTKLTRIISSSDFPKIVKSTIEEYVQSSEIKTDDDGQFDTSVGQKFGFSDDLNFGIFDFNFNSDKIEYKHLLMPIDISELSEFHIKNGIKANVNKIVRKYRKLVNELNSSFLKLGDNGLAFANGLCPLKNVIQSPKALEDAIQEYYHIDVWKLEDAQTFIKYINDNWNNLEQPKKDVRIFMSMMLRQRHQFDLENYQRVTDKFSAEELLTFYNRFNLVVDSSVNQKVIPHLFTKNKIKELLTERANEKAMVEDDLELFGLGNFFEEWSSGSGEELPKIKMVIDGNCDIRKINHQLKSAGGLTSSIRRNLFTVEVVIADDDDTLLTLLYNQYDIGRFFEKMKEFTKKLQLVVSENTVLKLQQMQKTFESDCEKWFTQAGKEQFIKIMNSNLIALNQFLEQNKELVEVTRSEEVNKMAETIKAGSEDDKEIPAKFVVE